MFIKQIKIPSKTHKNKNKIKWIILRIKEIDRMSKVKYTYRINKKMLGVKLVRN